MIHVKIIIGVVIGPTLFATPNVIVIGSGFVTAKKMAKFDIPLNLISILLVSVLMATLVPLVWE